MLAEILPKIAADQDRENCQQSYRPRPSLAGPERCLRSLVYHANGTPPEPFPGRSVMVFDDSSWHEELTADWIQKSAYTLHSRQMKVETPVGLGAIDGIVTDLLGIDRLLEHKALNHFSFERIWNGDLPKDYITQTCLYLKGLWALQPDLREGLLLIKNKNTAQYLELLLRYDESSDSVTVVEMVISDGQHHVLGTVIEHVCQSAVEKFREVERHRQAATLPRRPFEYGTEFPCGYCRWWKVCWAGYEQEFQALATEQALDQDLVDMAAYYCETRAHLSDMEKERDELKEKIKATMEAKGLRHGKTSQYAITLALREKASWDESQVPPDVVARAKRKTPYLQLDVRKLKEKEATNGNGHEVQPH